MVELSGAIFSDCDGVLRKLLRRSPVEKSVENCVIRWEDCEILPGVQDGLHELHEAGWPVFMISNQCGIGNGHCTFSDIEIIFQQMQHSLWPAITSYRFCPHETGSRCACKKPSPGMIYGLALDYDIDLGQSWVIGDQLTDMQAGHRAGIFNLIYIDDGHDPVPDFGDMSVHVHSNFGSAARRALITS